MKFSPQLKQEILNEFKGYEIFLEPEAMDIYEELKIVGSIHNGPHTDLGPEPIPMTMST